MDIDASSDCVHFPNIAAAYLTENILGLRSAKTPDACGEGGHILNVVQESVYMVRFF